MIAPSQTHTNFRKRNFMETSMSPRDLNSMSLAPSEMEPLSLAQLTSKTLNKIHADKIRNGR